MGAGKAAAAAVAAEKADTKAPVYPLYVRAAGGFQTYPCRYLRNELFVKAFPIQIHVEAAVITNKSGV